jgi:large subunit ribosomal protein L7/L12
MVKVESLVKEIGNLSVLELAQLTKELESLFGVSAAMMVGSAAPAAGAAAGGEAAAKKDEEKAEYKVEITDGGDQKIKVIKALRQVKKDLGLTEAKKMVEETPSIVAEGVPVADAKAMKEALEAAGAKVKLS